MNILAGWPGRDETIESAAERIFEWLEALRSIHPAFANWRAKGGSRAAATASDLLPTDLPGLVDELWRGADRLPSGELTPVGASISAWSPTEIGDTSLRISCCTAVGAFVKDNVNLHVTEIADDLGSKRLEEALRATVEIWQPTTAGVTNTRLLRPLGWTGDQPRIGWLTYLRTPLNDPGGIEHESLGEGILLRATPEFADFTPADLEPVRDALAAEGRWT